MAYRSLPSAGGGGDASHEVHAGRCVGKSLDYPNSVGLSWLRCYTLDERGNRPHVHVIAGSGRASIYIGERIEVGKISRMSRPDVHEALEVVAEHADELFAIWKEYNG